MRHVRASEIESKTKGTSRDLGRVFADFVLPGDVIDFSDFKTVNNSFTDEFIWRFFEKTSESGIESLHFKNESALLRRLIQRAIDRRVLNVAISSSPNPQVYWKSVDFLSELSF